MTIFKKRFENREIHKGLDVENFENNCRFKLKKDGYFGRNIFNGSGLDHDYSRSKETENLSASDSLTV